MRWEDERYVRIYTRDTPDWLAMQWQGRVVFYELARKVDRAGFLAMGKSGMRGIAGCLHLPLEVVETGIGELVTDGCVARVEGGILIRNFIEAQETPQSDRARKRSQRERDRDSKKASAEPETEGHKQSRGVTSGHAASDVDTFTGHSVTNRDVQSQNVTESHERSRAVTSGHAESHGVTPYRAVPSRTEPDFSHTQRAPADARETMPEPPPSSQPGACAFDDFAAMLSEVPALAVLSGDRMALSGLHQGFVMAHKGRATLTLATQAAAALVAQGVPEDRLAARKLLGRFLANQRPEGERESPAVSPDARAALEVFGEVWAAKKRRAFVAGVGDEKHATALVEAARQHAERLGVRPREVVRFWAEKYLADDEKFVADPEHPLRLLPSRLTSYGAPKAERPAKAPQAPKEAPVLVAAPPPANLASGLVDAAKAARDGAMPKRPGASS